MKIICEHGTNCDNLIRKSYSQKYRQAKNLSNLLGQYSQLCYYYYASHNINGCIYWDNTHNYCIVILPNMNTMSIYWDNTGISGSNVMMDYVN